jgi:hypothetical protein
MLIRSLALAAAAIAALGIVAQRPVAAAPLPLAPLASQAADPLAIKVQHRFGGRGGGRVYAPRGPRYVGPRVVGPRVVGPRVVGRPVGVWRPRRPYVIGPGYRVARPWWRPGTAVAAGAAIGFIGAAAAYSWAGQPPAPGYCWYYTDPSQQAGFWDICPQ